MKTANTVQAQSANANQTAAQEPKLKLSKQTIQVLTSTSFSPLEATRTRLC